MLLRLRINPSQQDDESTAKHLSATLNFPRTTLARKNKSLPARVMRGDFRMSAEYAQLEITEAASNKIVFSIDGKIILGQSEGNINCTIFLTRIESLLKILKVKAADRSYRKYFTQPYVGLYNDEELCYIPEILDAAQERQPFIVLNGEKYYFSFDVMRAGDTLYDAFVELRTAIKVDYELYFALLCYSMRNGLKELELRSAISHLSRKLQVFDFCWVHFEKVHIDHNNSFTSQK